jgi:putative ABC transport system permease protein
MGDLIQDLRYALRQLRASPGFAVTAIVSLTLGIGATTAMFSVVYGVLLDPYPYKDAGRMVHVELRDKSDRGPLLFVSGPEYDDLRKVPAIDDIFLQQNKQQTLTGEQLPVSLNIGYYSPNLFEYMGVPPILGREFSAAETSGGSAPPVAVLSYLFWKRQFGGSRDVIGHTLQLDRKPYTIIGVVPPRFTWGDSDAYIPALPTADPHDFRMAFIKLKPGVSYAAATAQLQILVDAIAKVDPKDFRKDRRVRIVTLNEEVLGKFAGTLVLLFSAVLALLVIGCSNVSILLLARGASRQHELALRASIGASRARVIRQLLSEAVLLSVAGTVLGVILAYRGVTAIAAMLPPDSFPHEAAIHVNSAVLIFSALLAIVTGILFGISPAFRLSRPELAQLMQSSSTKHSGSARGRSTHRVLIASQIALTLLIMAGAGAAMKAFLVITRTPLGFDPEHVVAMTVNSPAGSSSTWRQRANVHEQARQAVAQVRGVIAASISTSWFPPFGGFDATVEVHGRPALGNAKAVLCLASPQIFDALRVPLLSGRNFEDAEVSRAAHIALVNQSFVKQFLGTLNPIGQRVRSEALKVDQPPLLVAEKADDWLEIIGVVGDARNDGLDHPVKPAVFLPYSFVLPPDLQMFIRTKDSPETTVGAIKEQLRGHNAEMIVAQDHTLTWWLENQGWGHERFIATIFSLFAGLALSLAAAGIYSVVSYSVNQRTQEVGIRMALGSPRTKIVRLVLGSTVRVLGIGIAVGLALSLLLSRVVVNWTRGSSGDPFALGVSALLLIAVASVACLLPAWRAASIDPMRALRME